MVVYSKEEVGYRWWRWRWPVSTAVVAVETPVKLVVVQVEHHIIKLLNHSPPATVDITQMIIDSNSTDGVLVAGGAHPTTHGRAEPTP